jgi:methanogenic corrinoid protein MtbC1
VLERAGCEVLALGAATPPRDLLELVDSEQPDVVAISTATAGRLPGVEDILRRLNDLTVRPTVVLGGSLYTDEVAAVARAWGADLVTSDLRVMLGELRARFAAPASTE